MHYALHAKSQLPACRCSTLKRAQYTHRSVRRALLASHRADIGHHQQSRQCLPEVQQRKATSRASFASAATSPEFRTGRSAGRLGSRQGHSRRVDPGHVDMSAKPITFASVPRWPFGPTLRIQWLRVQPLHHFHLWVKPPYSSQVNLNSLSGIEASGTTAPLLSLTH